MIARLDPFLRDDDAQAVVELALALPLVALMLLGLVEFGFALNTRQELEGIARQGARTFALTGDASAMEDVLRISGRQLSDFNGRATIEVNLDPADKKLPRAFSAKGRITGIAIPPGLGKKVSRGGWVEVIVTYDFPNPVQATVFGSRPLPATIPLSTRAVARLEVAPK